MSAADLDAAKVAAFIRATVRANAALLALDPASITSNSPHSVAARTTDGSLLRLDFQTYSATELTR
jgi:hypothetical protein